MTLKCIYSVSQSYLPFLFNREVMQKNLIVHPHHHLSELTTFCTGGRDLTEFCNFHLLLPLDSLSCTLIKTTLRGNAGLATQAALLFIFINST